ncbi:unnamed protein product [Clonostachys rhizophaga]|uniref:Alcohol acetyltransferase n=1 Tax=Clonostachys rhizophaga TaxID=160324 RepID=A0A9N9V9D1_9HYPO|nr:unnamed protein product [Clonostachys rhizophaga]
MGIFRCVIITARYQPPSSLVPCFSSSQQDAYFTAALASVVKDQPMLRVGLLHEDNPKKTSFSHVENMTLSNHFEYRSVHCTSEDDYERQLASTQSWLHDQLWPNLAACPPWRIIILRPVSSSFSTSEFDIMFGYHHSLFDGTSGKEFHQYLLAALQSQPTNPDPIFTLHFPSPPQLPLSQEEAIGFKNSYSFLLRGFWNLAVPSFFKSRQQRLWTAQPIRLHHPYKTRIHVVEIDAASLASLLIACRAQSSSLTSLLHALILSSLSRRMPTSSFCSSTPISLRPWISDSTPFQMRSLTTAHATPHPLPIVLGLGHPSATDALIWESARRVKQDVQSRLARIPIDDPMGFIPLIPDLMAYWRGKEGQPRDETWEVSNLGILEQDTPHDGWEITRALFSSGAMVTGAAMGFNVISVRGKGLTIGVTWQDGDIDEELVRNVARDIENYIKE